MAFKSTTRLTYIEPSAENLLGFIHEEAVKQLTGENRKDTLEVGLPSYKRRALLTVFGFRPLLIRETVEVNEPETISYALSDSRGLTTG